MGSVTLSVPEYVHKIMKKHGEVRWTEVARRAIMRKAKEVKSKKDPWREYALRHALENWDAADELIKY